MRPYLDLLAKIMDKGVSVQTGAYLPGEDRQPTARRLHAEQLSFDLAAGFPAVTSKPLWWRAVVAEWIWFMRGSGDGQYLVDQRVDSIWRSWFKSGTTDLGPVYPLQFRRMQGVRWQDRAPVQPDASASELKDRGTPLYSNRPTYAEYAYGGYRYGLTGPAPSRLVSDGYVVHKLGPHRDVVEVDQIAQARDDIRAVVANPFDRARRRIIVTLWNPVQVPAMALPPCHTFHMYDLVPPRSAAKSLPPGSWAAGSPEEARAMLENGVVATDEERLRLKNLAFAAAHAPGGLDVGDARYVPPPGAQWTLNLHLIARSIDAVKGLPFNIASYALMCHVMAAITGTRPGTLTITFNDVHIYDNQFDDVAEQLRRAPYPAPRLELADAFSAACKDLTIAEAHTLTPAMFKLVGYQHHPKLASESEVAV